MSAATPRRRRYHQNDDTSSVRINAETLLTALIPRIGGASPVAMLDPFVIRAVCMSAGCGGPADAVLAVGAVTNWMNVGSAALGAHIPPTIVPGLCDLKVLTMDCGGAFAMIVDAVGNVWSVGDNQRGQLGIGVVQWSPGFQRVETLVGCNATSVSCGYDHALVLLKSGDVMACGSNTAGQLGVKIPADTKYIRFPAKIETLAGRRVVQIASDKTTDGNARSMALLNTGELYVWGVVYMDTADPLEAARQYNALTIAVSTPMALRSFGHHELNDKWIVSAACGGSCIAVVLDTGAVYINGKNDQCWPNPTGEIQAGVFQRVEPLVGRCAVDVACHMNGVSVLLDTGDVVAWGLCGLGGVYPWDPKCTGVEHISIPGNARVVAIRCGSTTSAVLTNHGDAFVWGAGARTLLDVDQTYAAIAPTRIQRPVGTHLVDIAMCDDHAFVCAQSTWS